MYAAVSRGALLGHGSRSGFVKESSLCVLTI